MGGHRLVRAAVELGDRDARRTLERGLIGDVRAVGGFVVRRRTSASEGDESKRRSESQIANDTHKILQPARVEHRAWMGASYHIDIHQLITFQILNFPSSVRELETLGESRCDPEGNAVFAGALASPTIDFDSGLLTNAGDTDIFLGKLGP
jgi:hypothetical protein